MQLMCNIMESIIKDQRVQFLVSIKVFLANIIMPLQKHHSIASGVLDCLRDWSVGLYSITQANIH